MYKVLIAEDEEFIREGICNIIDWEGLELTVAHMAEDGQEALKLWEMDEADIIISDISMPKMNGLELLEEMRKKNKRTRFILLTGYEYFEYAKKAIPLDVEDYLLKPINECKMEEVLKEAVRKLKIADEKKNNRLKESRLKLFLEGRLLPDAKEVQEHFTLLACKRTKPCCYFISIKIFEDNLKESDIRKMFDYIRVNVPNELLWTYQVQSDSLLLLIASDIKDFFLMKEGYSTMQISMEEDLGIQTFITISTPVKKFEDLPQIFYETTRLQKYIMIYGYGCIIDSSVIENRTTQDSTFDSDYLHRLILKKDKEAVVQYLEDIFVNKIKAEEKESEVVSLEMLLQNTINMAMMLQKMKEEYSLPEVKKGGDLFDMLDVFYQAEDIFSIKSMFISQVIDIMDFLHANDSCYTPVIKQIISEVQSDYKDDMNLKTLAYKYHINTSYLGQLFQKEVGVSFSKFLCSTRNQTARELILSTNMRIHEIAQEVGYNDISYFYRKFKQSYGISPAQLREMKHY